MTPAPLTLELTEDDERLLADLAAAYGISPEEAAIRAVHEAAEIRRHEAPRARR